MSFIIFGDLFTFPDGQAATNRVYTYGKGFKENGINVHVIVFSSTYNEVHNGTTIDGISYYHPFEQKKRSNSFFVRSIQKVRKHIRTYQLLKKINEKDRIIAINSWTNLFSTHFFAWLLSKFLRTKLVTECSEHPYKDYQGGISTRIKGRAKFYVESRLCAGILCISHFLVDFHSTRGINPKKLFYIPSTVDSSRFIQTGTRPIAKKYIGYFGSLTFKRDNVDLLINAFARFSELHPDVYLVLGGFSTPDVKKQITDMISELGIQERVVITEYLTREEILQYIVHADVLVVVRSNDLEASASYPSKLSEFLATGRPVVTVNVGEIGDFITDKVNGFLIEPGDVNALTNSLDFIFNNYELAEQVGLKGKELTSEFFDYKFQAGRMIDYIHSLY
jgi:glycosyltransferase involved in cell wall biosynthesis